jgi:broad specificity phosphatase PhoE
VVISDPRELWLLRHGQSLGNVARERAPSHVEVLDIAERDMDVPLSALGTRQARALGDWFATSERAPDVVLASPYVRAAETARLIVQAAGWDRRVHLDERLRERELGTLDLLTSAGIAVRFPEEQRRRARLGKFYYRPPGGESWVDVALRLRSLRDSLGREHEGRRILIVAHEVVILMMRYLLDDLDEATVLGLGGGRLANCSLTTYAAGRDDPRLQLQLEGWTAPLDEAETPITKAPDARVGPR